jgi:GTPase SAR1 family protein
LSSPSNVPAQKLLIMGLGAAGKSSIKSVVFEGKQPEEVTDYKATINYTRSTKSFVGTNFQIFDCGGQESFINSFTGPLAEFIFSDVKAFVWTVDVSNFDGVSTSKFYFDLAIKRLHENSSDAVVFCLFHKADLLLTHMREQVIETMKEYFIPGKGFEVRYHSTSIFDKSVYNAFGEVIQVMTQTSTKARSASEAIQKFIEENKDTLEGITIYTDEGLPIIEEGEMTEKLVLPANLWLANTDRLQKEFSTKETLKGVMETDEFVFVFHRIKNHLLFTGVAKKIAPLQYVVVKVEQIAESVNKLLD